MRSESGAIGAREDARATLVATEASQAPRTVEAPLSQAEAPLAGGAQARPSWHPAAWLAGGFLVSVGFIMLAALCEQLRFKPGFYLFVAAVPVTFVYAGVKSFRSSVAQLRTASVGAEKVKALLLALGGVLYVGVGAFGALVTVSSGFRGRQLRRGPKVLLPPVGDAPAWASLTANVQVDDDVREALAAQWRENARTEHASVAAFARLTLDLVALGAPPTLIADAQRDALDETQHAELCFSLARALDGRALGPTSFPEALTARTLPDQRGPALVKLAVDSLVDGALLEGFSARTVATLSRRCKVPTIRTLLRQIAEDEWRHAMHGWDVVEWCVQEGGAPVLEALGRALRALPETAHGQIDKAAHAGAWEPYGIPGRALEAREYAKTKADLEHRVAALASNRATVARSEAPEALVA
jgi:hypothetical protein